MPYRRLPNTDKARIRALESAIKASSAPDSIFSYKIINEAQIILQTFKQKHKTYIQAYKTQISEAKKYKVKERNAKLYISHFIQILNFCVIRKEIKKDKKTLYGLEPDNYNVPDISTGAKIIEWGEKIINGEQKRTFGGGTPIYNPNIARVKVHYDIFKELYFSRGILQKNTDRALAQLSELRDKTDEIILTLWNDIESNFSNMPATEKIENCKKFGIIYYTRKKETEND